MDLKVTVSRENGVAHVLCKGEVDMHSARALADVLDDFAGEGFPDALIDLRAVTFFASHGIEQLLRAKRLAEAAGTTLTVAVSKEVEHILRLCGLEDRFDLTR